MEKSVNIKYEIGEMVAVVTSARAERKKAVVLGFEENKLFDSVNCVKIMIVGSYKPVYTLSDRICKL